MISVFSQKPIADNKDEVLNEAEKVEYQILNKTTDTRLKRRQLPPGTKKLLEDVFRIKQYPNRMERKLIAEKGKISPRQVRVWVCYY